MQTNPTTRMPIWRTARQVTPHPVWAEYPITVAEFALHSWVGTDSQSTNKGYNPSVPSDLMPRCASQRSRMGQAGLSTMHPRWDCGDDVNPPWRSVSSPTSTRQPSAPTISPVTATMQPGRKTLW